MLQVSLAQREAFDYLRGLTNADGLPNVDKHGNLLPPGPRFANPLNGELANFDTSFSDVGGLNFGDFGKQLADLEGFGGSAATMAASIKAEVSQIGIDSIGSSVSSTFKVIHTQTIEIVDQLPNVMSAAESASAIKQGMAAVEGAGEAPSVCDGIKDLMGSISEFGSQAFDAIKSAVNEIRGAVSQITDAVKGIFSAAYTKLKEAVSAIKTAVSGMLGDITSAVEAAFDTVRDKISDALSGFRSFVSNIGSAIKDKIKEFAGAISDKLRDLRVKIADELKKVGDLFDYLKDASISLSFPSLSPCAKDIIKATAGAAGAVALVRLVS